MSQIDDERNRTFRKITGVDYLDNNSEQRLGFDVPYALVADRERVIVQGLEVMSINAAANAIERVLEDNDFSRPTIYTILTVGMDAPENATLLGQFGEEGTPFASFPKTDIEGHPGEVYALKTDDGQTMLILKGRAHPNEWSKDPYGDMVVAHPLQVLKELARRGRAERGQNSCFILTYATGVRKGHIMKPGQMGVILDDIAEDNDTHPGHGARKYLDQYAGEKFQPKDGRASDIEIARLFVEFAKVRGITIFPTAAVGTPGTTEFQGSVEAALYDAPFHEALVNGNFGVAVRELSDEENAALLFCMGVTAELAAMRQLFYDEDDFPVLALALATDEVGGKQSKTINHQDVHDAAVAMGVTYRDLLLEFISSPEFIALLGKESSRVDHSIKKKLEN